MEKKAKNNSFIVECLLAVGLLIIAYDIKLIKDRLGVLEQKISSTASVTSETPTTAEKSIGQSRIVLESPSSTNGPYTFKPTDVDADKAMKVSFMATNVVDSQVVRIILPWGVRDMVTLSKTDDGRTITREYPVPEVAQASEGPVYVQLLADPSAADFLDEDHFLILVP